MKYVLLFLLVSCSNRPMYSFNEVVLFKHYDAFYAPKCSSVGTIVDVTLDDSSYVYTLAGVTCNKSEFDTTKVILDIPESHILKVVK